MGMTINVNKKNPNHQKKKILQIHQAPVETLQLNHQWG
jgi:hypothetical protein